MLKTMRKQGGFTLIEVVAAAALIGIMATMLLPSLSGANDRVKNARLQNDLVDVMLACAEQRLDEVELSWRDDWAVSVVLTSAGYPGSYEKGKVITGIEDAEALDGVTVYHAGTREQDGQILTNGGRVIDVTALGATFEEARNLAYAACEKIDFEGKTLRHDIGLRALKGRSAWDA